MTRPFRNVGAVVETLTFALGLAVKDAYRAAQITQAQAATMPGLSGPHLANALAGRYPLSKAKVVRLRAFLDHPPPIVQPRLL